MGINSLGELYLSDGIISKRESSVQCSSANQANEHQSKAIEYAGTCPVRPRKLAFILYRGGRRIQAFPLHSHGHLPHVYWRSRAPPHCRQGEERTNLDRRLSRRRRYV